MKIKVLFASVLAFGLAVGCQDDENKEKLSPLGVEEHKANLESSGLNVVDKFNDMADMEAVHVANDFMELLDATSTSEGDVVAVAEALGSLENGLKSAVNLKVTTVDDPSFGQAFAEEAGIYTYNFDTQDWDVEASDDQITYHFPTEGSTSNNATLSVTNFSYTTTTNPDLAAISDELLESVNVSLTVDDVELCLFTFSASYDADGIPTSVSENLTLDNYVLTTSVSRSSSKVSFDQVFEYDGANIISSHFENRGDIDYSSYISNSDMSGIDPFSESALEYTNVWIAVDNLKLEGVADWKGFQNSTSNISEEDVATEQAMWETMAELINDNASIQLKYNDSNEIIAVGEAYATSEMDEYTQSEYWYVDFRVKFSDGSYMDDSFFGEENFTDLMTSIDDLMTEMETNYGTAN
ncbi:hypothetical protein [Marinilabilia sp.]